MKFLKVSAFAMVALLGMSGEVAAMASNYHRQGRGETVQTDQRFDYDGSRRPTRVPEPGTLILTGLGIGTVAAFWRKARRHVTHEQGDRKR